MCGGIVHVFIHVLRDDARDALLEGLAAVRDERPAALLTLLDGEAAGAKLYVDASGSVGTLGGPALLDSNAAQEARGLTVQGRSTVRSFGPDGASLGSGCACTSPRSPSRRGCSSSGRSTSQPALAPLAKGLEYRVTIADPRRPCSRVAALLAVAGTVRRADDTIAGMPPFGPRAAVLVFTHDRGALDGAGRAGGASATAPATSARSGAGARRRTATRACARPA